MNTNILNHKLGSSNISFLLKELELAVNLAKLTRTEKSKLVLRLLKLQYDLSN